MVLLDSNIVISAASEPTPEIVHGLPLVTRNVDDFKHVTGLELVNPFAESETA